MPTTLLTWNPRRWRWANLPDCIRQMRERGYHDDTWGCGRRRDIVPGDRVFLMRQGREPRGLFASGWAASGVFEEPHWDPARAGATALSIRVRFDVLLDPDAEPPQVLRRDLLLDRFPQVRWDSRISGIAIPDSVAAQLEVEWAAFLALNKW